MHLSRLTLGLALAGLLAACATPPATPPPDQDAAPAAPAPPPAEPTSQPTSQPDDPAARASAAQRRLESSEAGRLVLASIQRHGGLEPWYAGRALRFRYAYTPVGGQAPKISTSTVEIATSRAYQDFEEPTRGQIAWDGEQAWSLLEDNAAVPARFWALTPYYFTAMPFVLGDPGVKLERSDEDPADAGFPGAHVVRVTFEAGTGDAPNDYYILYLASQDHTLLALRYVVSWAPFVAPRSIAHTPEKLLVYTKLVPVGRLTLPSLHTTYAFADGKRGEPVTTAPLSQIEHAPVFDPARLTRPEGAALDTSLDAYR